MKETFKTLRAPLATLHPHQHDTVVRSVLPSLLLCGQCLLSSSSSSDAVVTNGWIYSAPSSHSNKTAPFQVTAHHSTTTASPPTAPVISQQSPPQQPPTFYPSTYLTWCSFLNSSPKTHSIHPPVNFSAGIGLDILPPIF